MAARCASAISGSHCASEGYVGFADERIHGELRTALERAGRVIGSMDLLIAVHALHEDATLITNNRAEFARVAGLRIENWIQP